MQVNFYALVLWLALPLTAHGAAVEVTTVPRVDLQRYLGKWYEIAAIPMFFERNCTGNTTAEYSAGENDLIIVRNSCETKSGERSSAEGRARVVDEASHSKLEVTFVNLFGWRFFMGGDYWILALGENYSYAVVGSPNRKYAWILGRAPKITEADLRAASRALIQQGYEPCKLLSMPQAGGYRERRPVCDLTRAAGAPTVE